MKKHPHAAGAAVRTRLLLLAVVLLGLAACRPLYLPPLIEAEAPEERARLLMELNLEDDRPVLRIQVLSVVRDGWLAVQWYSPGGREVASESIWLEADSAGLTFMLPLPDDTEVTAGEWRALVSQHSQVIRQLSLAVP